MGKYEEFHLVAKEQFVERRHGGKARERDDKRGPVVKFYLEQFITLDYACCPNRSRSRQSTGILMK